MFIILKQDVIKSYKEDTLQDCIDNLSSCIDEAYLEIIESVDNLNKDLEKRTSDYMSLKNKIHKAINSDKSSQEELTELMEQVYEDDLLFDTIRLKDFIIKEISKSIPSSSIKISKVINESEQKLKKYKTAKKLIGMLEKTVYKQLKDYSEMTVSSMLQDNWCLDMYINTRNDLIDYIKEIEDIEIEVEQLDTKQVKKFKQRLRVSYDQLQRFAKHMGYEEIRQGNTTHKVWRNPETGLSNPIPNKSGTVPQGTVSRILNQMGLSRADLADFLYN